MRASSVGCRIRAVHAISVRDRACSTARAGRDRASSAGAEQPDRRRAPARERQAAPARHTNLRKRPFGPPFAEPHRSTRHRERHWLFRRDATLAALSPLLIGCSDTIPVKAGNSILQRLIRIVPWVDRLILRLDLVGCYSDEHSMALGQRLSGAMIETSTRRPFLGAAPALLLRYDADDPGHAHAGSRIILRAFIEPLRYAFVRERGLSLRQWRNSQSERPHQ